MIVVRIGKRGNGRENDDSYICPHNGCDFRATCQPDVEEHLAYMH